MRHTRLAVVAALVVALLSLVAVDPAAAAPGDVVISELMYHPADDAPVEFLELGNRGPSPENISGWCLASGIDFCFPADTVIGPGQFLVVTDDLAGFPGVYGTTVVPVGEYSGRLSNGGETVELLGSGGAVVDTVSYDDSNPWPAAPDGNGPSLELTDLATDNNLAENWLTSIAPSGHSVGAVNSVTGVVFPTIENVTATPFRPDPGQSVTVSARLADAAQATLSYVINWEAEQRLTMNDGPTSVGGAGDGVWSAVIPAQQAGDLIRYRVDVTGGGVASGVPDPTDTINYLGVVVVDRSFSTTLPVLEWFMDDAVHQDLRANHRFDDVTGPAVISYDGVVIDNVEMRIRGGSTRAFNKVNWKVEFPSGHLFDMGGLLEEPVDEFNMQRSRYVNEELGWGTADAAGLVTLPYFKIRTQRNGEFYSISTYGGTYDGRWRDNNGRDDWALYKAEQELGRSHPSQQALIDSGDWDKKEGDDDDWSDLHELTTTLDAPATQTQQDWMWENLNIPQVVNYAAVLSVLRHSDSGWYNYYVTRDTPGTGRWEMMLWDMDTMFRTEAVDSNGDFLTPGTNGQKFMLALTKHPEFRQMYFRRARTLIDEFLQPTDYEDWSNRLVTPYQAEFELDRVKWGGPNLAITRQTLFGGIAERRADVAAHLGPDGSYNFPPSATGRTPVEFGLVAYDPTGGDDAEFIQLRNTSTTESIDLSGWTIGGVATAAIVPGTVLVPGGQLYLVADDNAFRAANGADNFVAGSFSGPLPDGGGNLTLRTASGALVDTADDLAEVVEGTVTTIAGAAVADVKIDLFTRDDAGRRGQFLGFTRTDGSGSYSFALNPGCYILTFIAPAGTSFDGSQWFQPSFCTDEGQLVVDAVLGTLVDEATIGGTVTSGGGSPAVGLKVDLFEAAANGSRGQFLGFTRTDAAGGYSFDVGPGCYVLTFIAPPGQTFDGSRWFQPGVCLQAGDTVGDLDAQLDGSASTAAIGGRVGYEDGKPAPAAKIDLFTQNAGGGRGSFLEFTRTGASGLYSFQELDAGCYILTFIAPPGETFDGSPWFQPSMCVAEGQTVTGLDGTLDGAPGP